MNTVIANKTKIAYGVCNEQVTGVCNEQVTGDFICNTFIEDWWDIPWYRAQDDLPARIRVSFFDQPPADLPYVGLELNGMLHVHIIDAHNVSESIRKGWLGLKNQAIFVALEHYLYNPITYLSIESCKS